MGRFEPSNKRCNNSAPVFQHPLFTFHPSFFLRPSLPPCLTFTLLPPSPSFSLLEVSPTLTRNPLFAKQTRIVCSQESGSVVVAEEHRRRRWRARNFNYTNIIGTRHNCIIGFGNWRSTSRVIRAIFLGNIFHCIRCFPPFFFLFFGFSFASVTMFLSDATTASGLRVACCDISLESCSTGCSHRSSRDEWIRTFLIYRRHKMPPVIWMGDIVNILIKTYGGYLISNN